MDAELSRLWCKKSFTFKTREFYLPPMNKVQTWISILMICLYRMKYNCIAYLQTHQNILQLLGVSIFKPLKLQFSKQLDAFKPATLCKKNPVTVSSHVIQHQFSKKHLKTHYRFQPLKMCLGKISPILCLILQQINSMKYLHQHIVHQINYKNACSSK